jgi:predicted small lipoprotein YifL
LGFWVLNLFRISDFEIRIWLRFASTQETAMNGHSVTHFPSWLIGGLVGLAWLHTLPAAGRAEPLPLPPGDKVAAPWKPVLTLDRPELKPDEAAGFRVADDAKVGRALVVGPWLAGAWWAGGQYEKPFPPNATEVRGQYRTVDLLPYTAWVRADFYDAGGKRLNRVGYPLLPTADWTPFSVRFDKFPVGTARMKFSFGLGQHTQGEVWLAQLETHPAGPHPLEDLPAPKLTRPAPPPPQKGTGFWRVERFGQTWWLIDPEGRPSYSRATAPPNPPATWKEGLAAADKYVAQLRDWGFDGLAGWHSLRLYALYNRELKKQGRPTIPQFAVLNYHDS